MVRLGACWGPRRASSRPVEIRTDVGPLLAACLPGEQRFDIGQPKIIAPAIGADLDGVRAPIVGAIDQETANARGAHLSESDLLLAGECGHAPLKRESLPLASHQDSFPAPTGVGQPSRQKRTSGDPGVMAG